MMERYVVNPQNREFLAKKLAKFIEGKKFNRGHAFNDDRLIPKESFNMSWSTFTITDPLDLYLVFVFDNELEGESKNHYFKILNDWNLIFDYDAEEFYVITSKDWMFKKYIIYWFMNENHLKQLIKKGVAY